MDTRRFLKALGVLVGTAVIFAFGFGVWLSVIVAVPALGVVGLTALSGARILDRFVHRTFEAVQPDDSSLPEAVRVHWEAVGAELEERGFRRAGARRSPLGSDGAAELSASWTSADETYVVTSNAYHSPRRAGVVASPFLTVSTWHRDGRAIETTTSTFPPVFWKLADVEIVVVSGYDLDRLLDLHRARLKDAMPGISADVVEPRDAEAISLSMAAHERVCASLVDEGLLTFDDQRGLHPTRRGRMRAMLAHTWPITAVRRVAERRRVDNLLRRLGLLHIPRTRTAHWAMAISGLVAIAIALSLPGGLGSSSLTWTSMYVVAVCVSRRERRAGYAVILGGGGILSLLVVLAVLVPGLAYGIDALLVLSIVALFTAGATGIYWGWRGISYLHPSILRLRADREEGPTP